MAKRKSIKKKPVHKKTKGGFIPLLFMMKGGNNQKPRCPDFMLFPDPGCELF